MKPYRYRVSTHYRGYRGCTTGDRLARVASASTIAPSYVSLAHSQVKRCLVAITRRLRLYMEQCKDLGAKTYGFAFCYPWSASPKGNLRESSQNVSLWAGKRRVY